MLSLPSPIKKRQDGEAQASSGSQAKNAANRGLLFIQKSTTTQRRGNWGGHAHSKAWLYLLISYMIDGIITAFLASSWLLGGPRFNVSKNLV